MCLRILENSFPYNQFLRTPLSRNDPNTALSLKVGNGKDDFVAPLQIFRSFALIILEYFLNIYFLSIIMDNAVDKRKQK